MLEIWKEIKDYKGLYEVSNLGNIKSLSRKVERGNFYMTVKEKIISKRISKDGYYIINLSKFNKKTTFKVHRLVFMTFIDSNKNNKLVVDHINNNRLDNRLENLQLITQRENTSKDKSNGTSKYVGVTWNKKDKRWKSCIRINGKQKYLGYFINEYDAHLAYQNVIKTL